MLGPELVFTGRTEVVFRGETLTFFAGNDYHRFSTHPEVLRTLTEAAAQYGLNCAGSRATTGNHPLYNQLEATAAAYLGAEAAALCSAGYLSSTALLQAVGDQFTHVFLDEKAHSSLVDAARQSGLPITVFPHADPEGLRDALKSTLQTRYRPLVATDGVFANTGVIPPLADYAALIEPYNGRLLIDDAHGLGVVGPTGKGSFEEAGIPRALIYQTGTLSKGLGGFGGIVAGSRELIELMRRRSRAFIGSTPPPLPVAAATIRAIEILATEPFHVARLRAVSLRIKPQLRELGFTISGGPAPICSVTYLNEEKNRSLYHHLLTCGIYPSFINYPGCPPGGHFRFTLSSIHSDDQIDRLVEACRSDQGRTS
jgi:7-keto-8-aminopelargonate synthetase-like enzyme